MVQSVDMCGDPTNGSGHCFWMTGYDTNVGEGEMLIASVGKQAFRLRGYGDIDT